LSYRYIILLILVEVGHIYLALFLCKMLVQYVSAVVTSYFLTIVEYDMDSISRIGKGTCPVGLEQIVSHVHVSGPSRGLGKLFSTHCTDPFSPKIGRPYVDEEI